MDDIIKAELEEDNIKEQLFVPIIFIIITGIWGTLYFGLINFYSCSPNHLNLSCFLLPALSWTIWLVSSFTFIILCFFKIIREKQPIDILIFLGYGWLYGITLIMLFQ
jgi:magnesium-transporting ATPase (P-type)